MRERRRPSDIWRNDYTERNCRKCHTWKPVNEENWYVRASGAPIYADCRLCMNPSGRKAGRPLGSADRVQRQRAGRAGANRSAATARFGEITLNPNAMVDAAKRYGIDLAKIAARMAEDE